MAQAPILNRPAKTPTSAQQYIQMIEDLARRNRGGGTLQAYDTSSNTPYVIPGATAKEMIDYNGIKRNPVRPNDNSNIVYDRLNNTFIDQTTGEKYSNEDLQSSITSPVDKKAATEQINAYGNQINNSLPNVPTTSDLTDNFDLNNFMQGEVLGASTSAQKSMMTPRNQLPMTPISKIPINTPITPSKQLYMNTGKPETESKPVDPRILEGINTGDYKAFQNLGEEAYTNKKVEDYKKKLNAIDQKYQKESDALTYSKDNARSLKDVLAATDSNTGISDKVKVTDGLNNVTIDGQKSSLVKPTQDVPPAGEGITTLQNIFAPIAGKTSSIVKKVEDISPIKRIGEAGANIAQNIGGNVAKTASNISNSVSSAPSNVFKAFSNTIPSVQAASKQDSQASNQPKSATPTKTAPVATVTSTKTTSIPATKVSAAPVSKPIAAPKQTPVPAQKSSSPAPAKPQNNPVQTIINIFKKLFG